MRATECYADYSRIGAASIYKVKTIYTMRVETKLFLSRIVFCVALLNFAVFWIVAVLLGGDAVNGKIQNGHYYLMSHGHHSEVSERVFRYSQWHVSTIWITHPLAFVAGYWHQRLRRTKTPEISSTE